VKTLLLRGGHLTKQGALVDAQKNNKRATAKLAYVGKKDDLTKEKIQLAAIQSNSQFLKFAV